MSGKLKNLEASKLDELEAAMLHLVDSGVTEADCPTTHTFTANSYVREGLMPAGFLVIGHAHKEHHICVVLRGRMSLLKLDGTAKEIVSPCVFLGQPGRKLVYIHEDVLMQNIHDRKEWPAGISEDIASVESFLYDKSAAFKARELAGKKSRLSHELSS